MGGCPISGQSVLPSVALVGGSGARGRSRTDTLLRAADFESAASTSSATRASRGPIEGRQYSDSATFSLKPASISPVSRLTEIAVPEELLFSARCGDERAQSTLYTALAPATFGLIRRIVTSRALAEDLFQDTMMTVFERLGAFRGEAPLGAWVRRIAITKCLMYLRSPWHRARLVIDRDDDEETLSREELQRLVVPDARAEQ